MKSLIAAVLVAFSLDSSSAHADNEPESDRQLTAAQKAAVQKVVGAQLRFPEAAQYQDLRLRRSNGDPVAICGEVNVKNVFGEYMGFSRFVLDMPLDRVAMGLVGATQEQYDFLDSEWSKYCSDIPLPSNVLDFNVLIKKRAMASMDAGYRQQIEDHLAQWKMVEKSGNRADICSQVFILKTLYLQIKDQSGYDQWETIGRGLHCF